MPPGRPPWKLRWSARETLPGETPFEATREGWRAAYLRQPPARAERALAVRAADPERGERAEDESEGVCAYCGEPIPEDAHPNRRRFCSTPCRRAWHGRPSALAA
jgi:hypothetical protein